MEVLHNKADHIQYIEHDPDPDGSRCWMLTLWALCDLELHPGIWFERPISYRVIICQGHKDASYYASSNNVVAWMPANWTGVL